METKLRCAWCEKDDLYRNYHDNEWGKPVYDDEIIFEFLILETFQAGLSWYTVLAKRENFRKAFDDFDWNTIAHYSEEKMAEIVERHISPKISKADLLEAVRNKMISEQPAPTTKPKPGTKPSPATDPNFDPFINPDPDDQPEANSPEPTTKPKPGTKPAPTTNPDFDPFISPDPDDQPEAKGLDSFMNKVKLMGLIKKHTKRK